MKRTSEGYRQYAAEMQMMSDVFHEVHKEAQALVYAKCAAEYLWIANAMDRSDDQRRLMDEVGSF